MQLISYILVLMSCTNICIAQAKPDGDHYSIQTGTLNVVLANRNGVVIAADSRRSSDQLFDCNGNQQKFCDDSQKLFETGGTSVHSAQPTSTGGMKCSAAANSVCPRKRQFG